MKYVSIDLETTGLDADTCQILEFGAVIDDLDHPFDPQPCKIFHRFVKQPKYFGEPYALALNQQILYTLAANEHEDICPVESLAAQFRGWLVRCGFFNSNIPVVPAGKNFAGFDKPFLTKLPLFQHVKLHHRCLDPGSMYFDPVIDDVVPSTQECLRRAGLDSEVSHTVVEDALDVIRLIRWKLLGGV